MTDEATPKSHNEHELIAFRIGEQEFCVNIMSVREIRGWTPATGIPHAPYFVLGVINLRGVVLPIIDLSARLGMRPVKPTDRHVIIVSQVATRSMGLLVDGVSDILTVSDTDIQTTQGMSREFDRSFTRGILAVEGRMICFIDLDALFSGSESEAA